MQQYAVNFLDFYSIYFNVHHLSFICHHISLFIFYFYIVFCFYLILFYKKKSFQEMSACV